MATIYVAYCTSQLEAYSCPASEFHTIAVDQDFLTQVDSAVSAERIADMSVVFGLFVLALVTVWGIKQVLRLFTGDIDK